MKTFLMSLALGASLFTIEAHAVKCIYAMVSNGTIREGDEFMVAHTQHETTLSQFAQYEVMGRAVGNGENLQVEISSGNNFDDQVTAMNGGNVKEAKFVSVNLMKTDAGRHLRFILQCEE